MSPAAALAPGILRRVALGGVVFGPWHPLAAAAAHAPAQPGVLQARGEQLLAFPRGKSAMILYAASGADESLAAFVVRQEPLLAQAAALGACYVRYGRSAQPAAEVQRLLANFTERFGAAPPANQAPPVSRFDCE